MALRVSNPPCARHLTERTSAGDVANSVYKMEVASILLGKQASQEPGIEIRAATEFNRSFDVPFLRLARDDPP